MKYTLLLSSLFLLLMSSCVKENFDPQTDFLLQEQIAEKKKDPFCLYNGGKALIREFFLCGKEYYFQGELRIANQGNNSQGYIQAIGKCYRPDNPNIPVNAEIEIKTWGNARISCQFPIDITVPSEYNANLQNGEVPNYIHCIDCSSATTTIQYWKNIGLTPLDQIHTRITLNIASASCGEVYKETIDLDSSLF